MFIPKQNGSNDIYTIITPENLYVSIPKQNLYMFIPNKKITPTIYIYIIVSVKKTKRARILRAGDRFPRKESRRKT